MYNYYYTEDTSEVAKCEIPMIEFEEMWTEIF